MPETAVTENRSGIMAHERRLENHGLPWVLLVVVACTPFLFDWTAVFRAATVWYVSPTYQHCPLVVLVAGYCLWRQRHRVADLSPQPWMPGFAAIVGISLLWLLAWAVDIDEMRQLLLVAQCHALVLTFAGPLIYRRLLFPLWYLFFAVPAGAFIVPWLQDFTTWFCAAGLTLLGIPHVVDGYFITVSSGVFKVAEACAGLRFLVATVAFAFLFGYLTLRDWQRQALFLLAAIVIPILINGLRALALMLIAHISDHQLAVGIDHYVYGWGFFLVVLAVLIALGLALRDRGFDRWKEPVPDALLPTNTSRTHPSLSRLCLVGLFALIVHGAAPAYAQFKEKQTASLPLLLSQPVNPASTWQQQFEVIDWAPNPIGTVHYAHQRFRFRGDAFGGQALDVFQITLQQMRNEWRESVAPARFLADPSWRIVGRGKANFSLGGITIAAASVMLERGDEMRTIYYWYHIGGKTLGDAKAAWWAFLQSKLLPINEQLGILFIAVDQNNSSVAAHKAVRRFLLDTPEFRHAFVGPGFG